MTTALTGSRDVKDCVCSQGYYHPCPGDKDLAVAAGDVAINQDELCKVEDRNWQKLEELKSKSAEERKQIAKTQGLQVEDKEDETTYFCRPCNDGLICDGPPSTPHAMEDRIEPSGGAVGLVRIHKQPRLKPGYYSYDDLENRFDWATKYQTFACKSAIECPGGALGTCGFRRAGSFVCSRCAPEYEDEAETIVDTRYYDNAGRCQRCGDAAWWPLLLFFLLFLFFLSGAYFLINAKLTAAMSSQLATSLAMGALIQAAQYMSVYADLDIKWKSPFTDILEIFKVFSFDIEVLRFACVAFVPAESVYATRVWVMPGCIFGFYVVFYVVFKALNASGRVKEPVSLPRVLNTVGQLYQMLFTMIAMTTSIAFNCYTHPDGVTRSVRRYPEVKCGDSTAHAAMMTLGVLAILVLIMGFMSVLFFVAVKGPRMSQRDPRFLTAFRFAFFRFNPNRYYWATVLITRNLSIAFVPVLSPDDQYIQFLILTLILVSAVIVQCVLWPWRSNQLNWTDTVTISGLLFIIVLASAFQDRTDDPAAFQVVIILMFGLMIGTILGIIGKALYAIAFPPKPTLEKNSTYLRNVLTGFDELITLISELDDEGIEDMRDSLVYLNEHDLRAAKQALEAVGDCPTARKAKKAIGEGDTSSTSNSNSQSRSSRKSTSRKTGSSHSRGRLTMSRGKGGKATSEEEDAKAEQRRKVFNHTLACVGFLGALIGAVIMAGMASYLNTLRTDEGGILDLTIDDRQTLLPDLTAMMGGTQGNLELKVSFRNEMESKFVGAQTDLNRAVWTDLPQEYGIAEAEIGSFSVSAFDVETLKDHEYKIEVPVTGLKKFVRPSDKTVLDLERDFLSVFQAQPARTTNIRLEFVVSGQSVYSGDETLAAVKYVCDLTVKHDLVMTRVCTQGPTEEATAAAEEKYAVMGSLSNLLWCFFVAVIIGWLSLCGLNPIIIAMKRRYEVGDTLKDIHDKQAAALAELKKKRANAAASGVQSKDAGSKESAVVPTPIAEEQKEAEKSGEKGTKSDDEKGDKYAAKVSPPAGGDPPAEAGEPAAVKGDANVEDV